ncbi:ABC transporter ATP-binding protein [Halobacteriovorax vibrionivorans]|uniref:ABC transporter ATP-binding protein n=1 Tax=Halobacteriovorax vibrionivorans TaxID=2152716 RepID=A0ABY0IGJ8_9BACT|nr:MULTISPECIES: ABC transporter ATP-binding protein [Halobacteriovorax]RZF22086.1 ABC transporter ATP-binding protein [Halobacteriovorax vibrionivorans]TGD46953.1 ABC transporter ATP-binding protein [Halobacteriovorax sp. Y22]
MFETIKNIWPLIHRHRLRVIGSMLFGVGMALIKGGQVALIGPLFNKGLSPDSTMEDILSLVGLLCLLALINLPVRFFHFYWMEYSMNDAICEIRTKIYSKIQDIPISFYTTTKQGDVISTILNDTMIYSQGISGIITMVREPVTLIVLLGYAFYIDWQLTLVTFAILPLMLFVFTFFGKRVRAHQEDVQRRLSDMTHIIGEGVGGQKIIKAFNLQDYTRNFFKSYQREFFDFQMKAEVMRQFSHPLVEFITTLTLSAVIVFAQIKISGSSMSTGDFITFIGIMAMIQDPIRKTNDGNLKINQAQAAEKRIFKFLKVENEADPGTQENFELKERISFKNLDFSYGDNQVINNLSFDIEKGEKVALVGLSGSGKSTLINVLLGLYPVKKGSYKIDGVDSSDFTLKGLREYFGLVSQDIFLFNTTIRENLMLDKDVSEEKLEEALKVAHATDYINELPEGLETIIGDRGVRLSGGQAQRLTIARAYLQDNDVFLFDEATSALDNESEKVVQESLNDLAKNKTVVAVAHRLSTIQNYDKIIVLKDGQKIEQGRHEELMALGGEYKKLYELSMRS